MTATDSELEYYKDHPEELAKLQQRKLDAKIEKVMQVLPNLEIHQYRPILKIPVGLDQPTTMLGKVAVILNNRINSKVRNRGRITGNVILQLLRNHGWETDGAQTTINQLIQWEILVRSGYHLLIQADRFKTIPHTEEIEVK